MFGITSGNLLLAIILAMLAFAIVLVSVSLGAIASGRRMTSRRLALPDEIAFEETGTPQKILPNSEIFGRFTKFVTPTNVKELSKTRQKLIRAGFRHPSAVGYYYLARITLPVIFALAAAILVPNIVDDIPPLVAGLLVVLLTFVGFMLPGGWVAQRGENRREEAELGFPDVLDLILICVEAGNSIDQALWRVVKEIDKTCPVLADELGLAAEELKAGKERPAVFRDFAARVNVDDISAFATVLRQSDEFGVSIAETLRVYAGEMRFKRIQRAEEKANIMPMKLAMATMLFTVPVIMFILGAPSVLAILGAFEGL